MARLRNVAVVLLSVVLLASCTPQELGEFFSVQDLRASSNRQEAAAGHVVETIDKDEAAQELVDEGLRDKSRDKLADAYRLRPEDARYRAYSAALAVADGDKHAYLDLLLQGSRIYMRERQLSTDASTEAIYGEWLLVLLGAFDRALLVEHDRQTPEPDRIQRLEEYFCATLAFYRSLLGPPAQDVFDLLYIAGRECPASE